MLVGVPDVDRGASTTSVDLEILHDVRVSRGAIAHVTHEECRELGVSIEVDF